MCSGITFDVELMRLQKHAQMHMVCIVANRTIPCTTMHRKMIDLQICNTSTWMYFIDRANSIALIFGLRCQTQFWRNKVMLYKHNFWYSIPFYAWTFRIFSNELWILFRFKFEFEMNSNYFLHQLFDQLHQMKSTKFKIVTKRQRMASDFVPFEL